MQFAFPSSTSLILAGHGSTLNSDSARPAHEHVATLRRRAIFDQVLASFWKEEPFFSGVMRGIWTERALIVPLFISEGYFTEEVLPRELGFRAGGSPRFPQRQCIGGVDAVYCAPVGTHESMTEVLLARAASVARENPFPRAAKPGETALFIAGHGTGNNENSRVAIERQVELIRARNLYAEVHAIFMEESPRIEDCYEMAASRNLIVAPFFISDGLHSYEDIPVMLGMPERIVQSRLKAGQASWRNPTELKGKLVWYARSIGDEPKMVEVILQRAAEGSRLFAGPLQQV